MTTTETTTETTYVFPHQHYVNPAFDMTRDITITIEGAQHTWSVPMLTLGGNAFRPNERIGGNWFANLTAAQLAHKLLADDIGSMADKLHPLVASFLAAAGLARPGVLHGPDRSEGK